MAELAQGANAAAQTPAQPEPIPRTKRWIIAAVGVYLGAFAGYFLLPAAAFILKYVVTIGGILLGTVVREAADKQWKLLRVVAICVPLVAVALVQAVDGRKAAHDRAALELEESRQRARDQEAKLREQLVPDAGDSIKAIRGADRGFRAKAALLAVRARLQPGEAPRLRKLEAAYRGAAADFARHIKPQYQQMLALDRKTAKGDAEFRARLQAVAKRVAGMAAARGAAGVYNHAGALAQAAERGDEALAYFYKAVTLEPDHLPAYESLGYALWRFNNDAYGALLLAKRGLEQAVMQRAQIGERKAARPYVAHLDAMESRLRLQYAYFSAIQFVNEKEARNLAAEELRRAPDDAEAQDTMGYVILRFAHSSAEVEDAMALFRKASRELKAETITERLAAAHLQQAEQVLARFQ